MIIFRVTAKKGLGTLGIMHATMSHLSHEGGLPAHVGSGDEDAGGQGFPLALLLLGPGAADEDVVGDEVVSEEGLCDARVAGTDELQEGRRLVSLAGKQDFWPGHWSISPLTVAGQAQQHI